MKCPKCGYVFQDWDEACRHFCKSGFVSAQHAEQKTD